MQKLITKELKRLILYYHKETNIFAAVEKVSSPCKILTTLIYIIHIIYHNLLIIVIAGFIIVIVDNMKLIKKRMKC